MVHHGFYDKHWPKSRIQRWVDPNPENLPWYHPNSRLCPGLTLVGATSGGHERASIGKPMGVVIWWPGYLWLSISCGSDMFRPRLRNSDSSWAPTPKRSDQGQGARWVGKGKESDCRRRSRTDPQILWPQLWGCDPILIASRVPWHTSPYPSELSLEPWGDYVYQFFWRSNFGCCRSIGNNHPWLVLGAAKINVSSTCKKGFGTDSAHS